MTQTPPSSDSARVSGDSIYHIHVHPFHQCWLQGHMRGLVCTLVRRIRYCMYVCHSTKAESNCHITVWILELRGVIEALVARGFDKTEDAQRNRALALDTDWGLGSAPNKKQAPFQPSKLTSPRKKSGLNPKSTPPPASLRSPSGRATPARGPRARATALGGANPSTKQTRRPC